MAEVSHRTPRRRTPRPARSHQRPLPSTLQLKDTGGRNRIVLQVTPDGTPKDPTPRRHRKSHKGDHRRAMTPKWENRIGHHGPKSAIKIIQQRYSLEESSLSYLSVLHT